MLLSRNIWEQVNFQWDDDVVRFVLDQYDENDIYNLLLAHWNNSLWVDMSVLIYRQASTFFTQKLV
jgi:hypothetical protein